MLEVPSLTKVHTTLFELERDGQIAKIRSRDRSNFAIVRFL
jgi:hypothetical protein